MAMTVGLGILMALVVEGSPGAFRKSLCKFQEWPEKLLARRKQDSWPADRSHYFAEEYEGYLLQERNGNEQEAT